jgi:hypothetical protein
MYMVFAHRSLENLDIFGIADLDDQLSTRFWISPLKTWYRYFVTQYGSVSDE